MPPWPRPLRPHPLTSLKPLACCRRFLKLLARKTRCRSTNRIRELNDTISRLTSRWASTNRIPRVTWIECWSSLDARPRFWPEKWRPYQLELIILPSLIVRDRERQRQRQTERNRDRDKWQTERERVGHKFFLSSLSFFLRERAGHHKWLQRLWPAGPRPLKRRSWRRSGYGTQVSLSLSHRVRRHFHNCSN